MRHPPLATGWIDRPHQTRSIGRLELESGACLEDCRLVWVEHGSPCQARNNTVLALTAIGSTHHRLDFLIGPGRALDPRHWHMIVIDALGNGLSSSPSQAGPQAGSRFPRITLRDMVHSQHRLLRELGIDALHAVIGASMGGMQALQWAVSHPYQMRRVVALTPMSKTHRWAQLMNELTRRALFEDAECTRPRARAAAMRLFAPLAQWVMASSPKAVAAFASRERLERQLEQTVEHFIEHGPDPFDWLIQSRAYDAHDLGTTPGHAGDTAGALASILAEVLVLAPALDLYNPGEQAEALTEGIARGRFLRINSDRGHQAASGVDPQDSAFLNREIGQFLHHGL